MIKVEKIRIEEFRGIRDLTLELNGKNFAVCGPNGTGKSGIVDALEFAFTGNVSRLSGEGMGNVSVKEHAPHVDSRNSPEKARITITFKIPSLNNKEVILERTVKNPSVPKITPSSPEILSILNQLDGHPEFVLSRREIIRYVISKPGNRSEEVQALLRLDSIGELRSNLKTISNSYDKEAKDFKRIQSQAGEGLSQALGITTLVKDKVLEAVNEKRTILGLSPLIDLTATTALNDGLETNSKSSTPAKINKISATEDLKTCSEVLQKIATEELINECIDIKKQLVELSGNPIITDSVSRDKFLQNAVDFITADVCPVCDTKWDAQTLKGFIQAKLKKFEEVTKIRSGLEKRLVSVISTVEDVESSIVAVEKLAKVIAVDRLMELSNYRTILLSGKKSLKDFLPMADTISAIEEVSNIPNNILEIIEIIRKAVTAIPELTQQESARDYIVRAQDRLETYRKMARDSDKAKQCADVAKNIYDIYTDVSNKALEGVYKDVEKEFSTLYCAVNSEDEVDFTAKLTPSIGKLGFDVDFYGRGHFPPGAYHSEGHQDAMGLCLYLALMKKLQGNNFKFAVLDDVLMSVDTAHRREICNLLKQQFPDTQFVLTTHDEVWLKLMTTVGLISAGNATRFSNWNPDHGPTEWRTRDVWTEIDTALKANDIHTSASLLRYYLEHIFREICDSLRAKVEFKGDGHYELGDTLSPAVRRLRDLILDGAKVAEAWGQNDVSIALKLKEKDLGDVFVTTNTEQWLINPAVHYNEWSNFSVKDFEPVVIAFKKLVQNFFCKEEKCAGLYYLTTTPPKNIDALRCACGSININLKKPGNDGVKKSNIPKTQSKKITQ